jgi:hypothetical protein
MLWLFSGALCFERAVFPSGTVTLSSQGGNSQRLAMEKLTLYRLALHYFTTVGNDITQEDDIVKHI